MKNILVIQGGGRVNGNTSQLVDAFIRGAKETGNFVENISLNKTEVKGCIGCNACLLYTSRRHAWRKTPSFGCPKRSARLPGP